MDILNRKSLLAAAVAALIAMPGWAVAEQSPPSQPGGGEYSQQPLNESRDPAGVTAPAQAPPTATSPADQAGSAMAKPLYAKTPSEVDGMDVLGANGESLGEVVRVVRSRVDNSIQAVIAAGGILGYGAREVAVPLDDLRINSDKLQIAATLEDLKAKPEYAAEHYVELQPTNRPISEFSAFESAPKGGGSTTTP